MYRPKLHPAAAEAAAAAEAQEPRASTGFLTPFAWGIALGSLGTVLLYEGCLAERALTPNPPTTPTSSSAKAIVQEQRAQILADGALLPQKAVISE
jgi:hypothetical protein